MTSTFTSNALADEIALVTGASRGIGAAIAQALAAAGATVIGTATSDAGDARTAAATRRRAPPAKGAPHAEPRPACVPPLFSARRVLCKVGDR